MYRIRNVSNFSHNLKNLLNQPIRCYSLKCSSYQIVATDTEQSISIDVGDEYVFQQH